jgi:hypothetical protein
MDLRGGVHVLQAAAATDAKMGTAWLHTLGCGAQDLDHDTFVIATLDPGVAEAHPFPGQRPIDEDRFTLVVRQTTTFMRE